LMVAMNNGIHIYDEKAKTLELIQHPEQHLPENRFNDGKVDAKGRFWVGTMRHQSPHTDVGSLYRVDTDLSVHKMFDQVQISNGLAWTEDNKTMYWIDSLAKQVFAFDFDLESGNISNRRVAIQFPTTGEGVPDGMTIDSEGMLWVAQWDGSCVCRWDPSSGKRLLKVEMPVSRPTSCMFGGRLFDELYITSSAAECDFVKEPLAGSIFVLKNTGCTGRAEHVFGK